MRIGFDVDGVLADYTGAYRHLAKQLLHGKPDDSLVQTSWDFNSLGLTPDEEKFVLDHILATPNWWMTLDVLPNTSSVKVAQHHHELFFVTSRHDTGGVAASRQTQHWLHDYCGITFPTVIVSHAKGPIIQALELDYFIDDRDMNLYHIRECHPDCQIFLHDQPYNQHVQDVTRVPDVNTFLKQIGAV
jgi:5'(3')-deoxyribonucleotidase